MKILVTGGAGFIGSNIVDAYIKEGHDVIVVDNLSTGQIANLTGEKIEFYNMDVNSIQFKELVLQKKPNIINHHAAQIDVQYSIKEPKEDANVNILSTIHILECIKSLKNCLLVYPSSAAVYGVPEYLSIDEKHSIKPISFYGLSKYVPEEYIRLYHEIYGIQYTILRYANVYGIRQGVKGEGGVISTFINNIIDNKPLIVFGDGEQTRDYIYVEDVVGANLQASKTPMNDFVNVSTNTSTSINELINSIKEVTCIQPKVIYKDERLGDIKDSYLSNVKMKDLLNYYNKISLKEGLEKTFNYCRENNKIKI